MKAVAHQAGLPCFAAGAFSNTWGDYGSDPILNAAGASRVDLIFNQQQIVLSGVEATALAVALQR